VYLIGCEEIEYGEDGHQPVVIINKATQAIEAVALKHAAADHVDHAKYQDEGEGWDTHEGIWKK
jgi:hypothetical protein